MFSSSTQPLWLRQLPRSLEKNRSVLAGFVESEKTRTPALTQATLHPAHSGLGRLRSRFSCRQIIHGDFVLNEVKLLLSVRRLFQKSLPGLELLLYVPLPFVGRHGGVT